MYEQCNETLTLAVDLLLKYKVDNSAEGQTNLYLMTNKILSNINFEDKILNRYDQHQKTKNLGGTYHNSLQSSRILAVTV